MSNKEIRQMLRSGGGESLSNERAKGGYQSPPGGRAITDSITLERQNRSGALSKMSVTKSAS